jgi:hypothetical protein
MFIFKGILTFLLLFLLFLAIVMAILFHGAIRNFRIFRSNAEKAAERAARRAAAEEEYFRRTSNKYYKEDETPEFDKDYFKGDGGQPGKRQEQKTARRTTSSEGVTIIDSRGEQEAEKKIFSDGEGEYVDFVEVENKE